MTEAKVHEVSREDDGRVYLVECPHCHHSLFRHETYLESLPSHRCPNCLEHYTTRIKK